MTKELQMHDLKIGAMAAVSASAVTATWIEHATAYIQLGVAVGGFIVLCLTAWYTWERANKIRQERKENE